MDTKFLEPEVPYIGRGTVIDFHTPKQKSKHCPGVTLPDLPLQGVEVTGGEERDREARTDDVTDGGKDQK